MNQPKEFLFGYRVLTDPTMMMDGEPYEVKRTWKERLFTRPWRPFKSTHTVIDKVPSTEVIEFQDYIVMHPELLQIMREQIENEK